MNNDMIRTARFSRCRRFRYTLSRTWGDGDTVMFVGLNPSTADDQQDDPTVRRCIGFAQTWGYGRLVLVNLFGYRSPKPSLIRTVSDPVGPSNDRIIRELVSETELIVVAWGALGDLLDRDEKVLPLLPDPYCLGTTKGGHPRHPLYLPATSTLEPFRRTH